MTTIVYTDGSTINNKRSSNNSIGGCGVFWGINDDRNISVNFKKNPITNNRCEIYAVILAIEIYIKNFDENKDKKIIIKTDSMLLVNTMTKWIHNWIKKGWKKADGKPVLNDDLLKILYNLINNKKFITEFIHVKAAHDFSEPTDKSSKLWIDWYGNNQADLLAREGCKKI